MSAKTGLVFTSLTAFGSMIRECVIALK